MYPVTGGERYRKAFVCQCDEVGWLTARKDGWILGYSVVGWDTESDFKS